MMMEMGVQQRWRGAPCATIKPPMIRSISATQPPRGPPERNDARDGRDGERDAYSTTAGRRATTTTREEL